MTYTRMVYPQLPLDLSQVMPNARNAALLYTHHASFTTHPTLKMRLKALRYIVMIVYVGR